MTVRSNTKCPVEIAVTAKIDSSVRFLLTDAQVAGTEKIRPVVIGAGTIIRANSILYSGAQVAEDCIVDHFCVIRENAKISCNSRVMNYTEVGVDCVIGKSSRVGGVLCNRVKVGNRTTTFGKLVHSYQEHGSGILEPSPELGDDVIVGQDAVIIGGIRVGSGARIGVGAVVMANVLPGVKILASIDYPIRLRHSKMSNE